MNGGSRHDFIFLVSCWKIALMYIYGMYEGMFQFLDKKKEYGKGRPYSKNIYKRGSITIYIVPHYYFSGVTGELKQSYVFMNLFKALTFY